jgi:hypothetical protein
MHLHKLWDPALWCKIQIASVIFWQLEFGSWWFPGLCIQARLQFKWILAAISSKSVFVWYQLMDITTYQLGIGIGFCFPLSYQTGTGTGYIINLNFHTRLVLRLGSLFWNFLLLGSSPKTDFWRVWGLSQIYTWYWDWYKTGTRLV